LPNNCSLWDCYNNDAVKHLARGGVSSRYLSGHQGRTRGDLLRNAKSWWVSASFSEIPMRLLTLI
jgi:hypothetical protein